MKLLYKIIALCLLWCLPSYATAEGNPAESEKIDVYELVFGHIEDSHEWHITNIGDTHISIPLPVIVKSSTGWHCFSSARLAHGERYEGMYLSTTAPHQGKIVEVSADGTEQPVWDFSMTKNVVALWLNAGLLIGIFLYCARWYKKKTALTAPGGLVGMMEATVLMIVDDVIKPCIGKGYERYAPYLLTAFFFILISNLMGLLPVFPGGAAVTGNIAITLVLALITFFYTNAYATKEYWKEIFNPEVPAWLKLPIPIMPFVEFLGVFTKPFSLTIRLFANIMAGHAAILSLLAVIFITAQIGTVINGGMTFISVLFSIFMEFIEVLVAFIQAYVFTILSSVYIGLSQVKEHKQEATH